MKIGFFDSGIGGITVLHDAVKMMPNVDYIYYADTDNVPYGKKTKEEVRHFVFDAVDFIVSQGVKAIVIACNTATSVAIRDLRTRYSIPIIGMEPAVKPAVEKNRDASKRVIVTATDLTLKEEKLQNLIDKLDNEHIVDLLSLQELVTFSERFDFSEETAMPYLKRQFSKYDLNSCDTVVLGCTHFTFYRNMIKSLLPEGVDIIDGNQGTVKNLKKILEGLNLQGEGSGNITFYNSGRKVEDEKQLTAYMGLLRRLD
ncbi:MAG: glutamate racemase [Sedimentibacter sp.]|uniref:glutamate racemase n=1 Tax=Sedimentibacter sp. TaxID=1960295 RepID=UPI003158CCA2